MRNFEFGTKVRAFAKLGLQKEPRWTEGIYLGDNTVEFRTGITDSFEDNHIKRLIRLEGDKELNNFVEEGWESLKKIASDAVLKFFPYKKLEFDEKEHCIICEGYSIAPAVIESESYDSFTETPAWQLCVEVHSHGSYWNPPDVDVKELDSSLNEINIVGYLLNRIWQDDVSAYMENISYSKMAESNF